MEWKLSTSADVHFEPEDLNGLRTLLNVVAENTQDLDGGIRSLDLGGNAQRVYNDLSRLANGERDL